MTNEVVNHIQGGLKDVKIFPLAAYFLDRSLMDPYYVPARCFRMIQAGMLFLFVLSAHPVL